MARDGVRGDDRKQYHMFSYSSPAMRFPNYQSQAEAPALIDALPDAFLF